MFKIPIFAAAKAGGEYARVTSSALRRKVRWRVFLTGACLKLGILWQTPSQLIRHLELAVILITVWQGEGDNVTPRAGDVNVYASGRWGGFYPDFVVVGIGNYDVDLAKIFQEDYSKIMAVDGGLDGRALGHSLDIALFNLNVTIAIKSCRFCGKT